EQRGADVVAAALRGPVVPGQRTHQHRGDPRLVGDPSGDGPLHAGGLVHLNRGGQVHCVELSTDVQHDVVLSVLARHLDSPVVVGRVGAPLAFVVLPHPGEHGLAACRTWRRREHSVDFEDAVDRQARKKLSGR
uniref:Transferred entry: 7.1.1.9 n=1 Tax=Steinernema glaseri TaxID=37863 RepID=A0A1I7ZNX4_9BILA